MVEFREQFKADMAAQIEQNRDMLEEVLTNNEVALKDITAGLQDGPPSPDETASLPARMQEAASAGTARFRREEAAGAERLRALLPALVTRWAEQAREFGQGKIAMSEFSDAMLRAQQIVDDFAAKEGFAPFDVSSFFDAEAFKQVSGEMTKVVDDANKTFASLDSSPALDAFNALSQEFDAAAASVRASMLIEYRATDSTEKSMAAQEALRRAYEAQLGGLLATTNGSYEYAAVLGSVNAEAEKLGLSLGNITKIEEQRTPFKQLEWGELFAKVLPSSMRLDDDAKKVMSDTLGDAAATALSGSLDAGSVLGRLVAAVSQMPELADVYGTIGSAITSVVGAIVETTLSVIESARAAATQAVTAAADFALTPLTASVRVGLGSSELSPLADDFAEGVSGFTKSLGEVAGIGVAALAVIVAWGGLGALVLAQLAIAGLALTAVFVALTGPGTVVAFIALASIASTLGTALLLVTSALVGFVTPALLGAGALVALFGIAYQLSTQFEQFTLRMDPTAPGGLTRENEPRDSSFKKFNDALSVVAERIALVFDPFWDYMLTFAGLFDYFAQIFTPLIGDMASNSDPLRMLFHVVKWGLGLLAEIVLTLVDVFSAAVSALGEIIVGFGSMLSSLHAMIGEVGQGILEALGINLGESGSNITEFGRSVAGLAVSTTEARAALATYRATTEEEFYQRGLANAALRASVDDLGKIGAQLTNVPETFKVARARFNATVVGLGANEPYMPSNVDESGVPDIRDNTFNITVEGVPDGEQFASDFVRIIGRDARRRTGVSFAGFGRAFNRGGA
jgi:hypothetical protein